MIIQTREEALERIFKSHLHIQEKNLRTVLLLKEKLKIQISNNNRINLILNNIIF